MHRPKLVTETHTLVYPRGLLNPEDLLNFYPLPGFVRRWDQLGLTGLGNPGEDFDAMRLLIMLEPTRPPIVKGTGGLRKIRFSPPGWNVGKSGAIRVGFAYREDESAALLVTVYSKHDQANIPAKERSQIKKFLPEAWKKVLGH